MPAGHLPSFSHFLPESDRPTPMEQLISSSSSSSSKSSPPSSDHLHLLKSEPLILEVDLNNNSSHPDDLLLPPPNPAPVEVELLGWDASGWGLTSSHDPDSVSEVTPLTNLLADPLFLLPFDTDSNKVDWEPCSSSSDPFAPGGDSTDLNNNGGLINTDLIGGLSLIYWPSGGQGGQDRGQMSEESSLSLLRNALQPHPQSRELRKVLSYPILSDVALSSTPQSTTPGSNSNSNSGGSVYYELLVEPEAVVIPTHVEELSLGGRGGGGVGVPPISTSKSSTLTISTTTHSNQSLSAKWTYTTTNPDGTPKGRKRVKKPKSSGPTSTTLTSPDGGHVILSISPSSTTPPTSGGGHSNKESCNLSSESSSSSSHSNSNSTPRKERSLHYCTICSKGFKDKYSVNVHVRTHTGEKPFACALCGKAFRQKAHLAKHHQTHAAKAASASNPAKQQRHLLTQSIVGQQGQHLHKTVPLSPLP